MQSGPFFSRPSAEEIENSVLVHEYGHLLGLVNLVYKSPVDHEDKDHPGHSNNEESVMYWAVESADLSNIITGQLPDDFDNDDRNDLAGMLSGDIPRKGPTMVALAADAGHEPSCFTPCIKYRIGP